MGLKISLLGQFNLQAEDEPIELPSRPAQSLLAYLALNAGVSHRREKLAGLLWPEATESNSRSYLRQALWRIRKSLETRSLSWEDYFHISDISVAFDDQADYFLDAGTLLETVEVKPVKEIIEIVRLYRGELLPGFYDEWILLERDRLQAAYHQKMNLLLERLIQTGRWDDVLKWGEQWILLGYSPEPAYRALLRAYAGQGDQGMVSVTYQRCVQALNRELGLEPSSETKRLYEQIRRGELNEFIPSFARYEAGAEPTPSFLDDGVRHPIEQPIFVAREHELSRLDGFLDLALAGNGRVVFVTGQAGSGKTTLVHEFTQRAQDNHTDLVVASGNCNAYTGIGDPYLPFREILELLTGDVEARYAAGAISLEHARLLWNALPLTVQTLVEAGSDLVDTFIAATALLDRARASTPDKTVWLTRLDELVERKTTLANVPNPQQSDLFEQYTNVLCALGRKAPLVLVVDDLQWADLGSISLLFHIGRHLAGSRILIVGAYRPEEVALGRDGARHPLEPVVNEFQREFGGIAVNVDRADSRDFVEALLDSERNQLGRPFREMLYRQTRGHPLFTVELLRGMQERGDLVQDPEGWWIEGPALDWETLPARVEAAIAERIGRLSQPLRGTLRVASVEGEEFTAEVVARVLEIDEKKIVGRLSSELDRKHRLVRARVIERLGAQRVSRYRFRNYLFQKYLYDNLDQVERSYLHEDVGDALEELYGDRAVDKVVIAPQLAWHFQEAGIVEKAIPYLRMAGEKALHLCAYQDGITHLNRGLELLTTLPDSAERAQQELALQLALGIAWQGVEGARAPEVKQAYTRAYELCQETGDTTQLSQVLGEMLESEYVGAKYHSARELAVEVLVLAQEAEDPLLESLGHWYLGFISFGLGEFAIAHDYLEKVISFYEPQSHHHRYNVLRGKDAGMGALAYDACCLWCLGYPDEASRRSQKSLALARELGQLFSQADVLSHGGCLFHEMVRDAVALKGYSEELMRISADKVPGWRGTGESYRGEALIMMGQVQEGIEQLRQGLMTRRSLETQIYGSGFLCTLAYAEGKVGHPGRGLDTLSEALALVEHTDERYCEAELHRLKGELYLMQDDEDQAETSFNKAIKIARRQSARSWELRAAISLARLWQKQGRTEEAQQALGPVYAWFTEGFDTPDLREARELLGELA